MSVKAGVRLLMRKLWAGLSLRKKLSIACVLMTVLPTILTAAITWQPYERAMRQAVFERNQNLAEQIANDIDRMFIEKIKILKIIANNEEIKSMDADRQSVVLKDIVAQNPEMQLAVVSDAAGQQIARWDGKPADKSINYIDRKYYQTVVETGATAISDVLMAKSTGKLGIVTAAPIKNDDQTLLGLLIVNIELQKLINRIAETKIGNTGFAYVVNHEGKIIIDPQRGLIENATDGDYLEPAKAAISGKTGWVEYEYGSQKRLAGYSYAPSAKWGVIAQQPLDEAMVNVHTTKKTGILILIFAAVVAALIGLAIAGALTKPIAEISEATNRLAAGDLTISLEVANQDELGQLAATFNNMTTQLAKRDEALRESEEKFRSLVDNINIGIYRSTKAEDGFVQVNPAMAKIFGYDFAEELMHIPMNCLYQNPADGIAMFEATRQSGFIKNKEVTMRKKDGMTIWCSITTNVKYDEAGNVKWMDGVLEDITERKRAEEALRQAHDNLESQVKQRTQELMILNEELHRISLSDGLTGIANRRYFDEFMEREWQRAIRKKVSFALIMLDIDFFKEYNDTYGHLAGDECLKQIANVLRNTTKRGVDLFARYGGEEFAVVLPDTDRRGAVIVGEAVRAGVEKLAIKHKESPVDRIVTVSLGIAVVVPALDALPLTIIAAADQALYQAKQEGRNRIKVAEPSGKI